ncbi:hypothetical protein [Roseibium sediminicola]|uniref:Secreted protein n=1 Tax=Roseibium sediminicola TaxID=2933272 RepID=A0ABT0GX86_9HYPH|nr:hypothetical protein [Roseibium sp. CAU 1639]MCK7614054.1 hypothetical protein [Roseibium sp. CAU 1639]
MSFFNARVLRSGGLLCAVLTICGSQLFQSGNALAEDCSQTVEAVWLDVYAVKAATQGDCGQGDISLTVSNSDGDIEFSETYGPEDLFGFYGLASAEEMRFALTDWITNYAQEGTSSKLPPWPQGADGPQAGEFPFYPEDGVGQELYEAVRAQDRRMICFIQGSESQLCLLQNPENGALEAVGVQTFPG